MPIIPIKWPQNQAALQELLDQLLQHCSDMMPTVEYYVLEGVEAIFAPRQTLRMLAVGIVLQASLMLTKGTMSFCGGIMEGFTVTGRKRGAIASEMAAATDFAVWRRAALALDKLNGTDVWRSVDQSRFYDHKLLRTRIKDINDMMHRGDTFNLMFKLRGGISRDQYGIQHEALFSRAAAGTKELVEEYHETVSEALELIADSPSSDEVLTFRFAFSGYSISDISPLIQGPD